MIISHRIRAVALLAAALFIPSVSAGTIYVNSAAKGADNGTTWTDAFTNVQSALATAKSGDDIWVAAGMYRPAVPNGNRGASFTMKSKVSLYGGFQGGETDLSQRDWTQNQTVLSGDLNGDDQPGFVNYGDNSYHVIDASNNAYSGYRLDGFTVCAGNAEPPEPDGGAMNFYRGGVIENCLFTLNSASKTGGAIFAQSPVKPAEFRNCIFRENRAKAGGAVNASGDCYFEDCTFELNQAMDGGGGAAIYGGNNIARPGFLRCVFARNHAASAGGAVSESGLVENVNCWFIGNSAEWGGAVIHGQTAYFRGCVFLANSAETYGGALVPSAAYIVHLENCTLVANRAGEFGGGIYSTSGNFHTVINSILWGNTSAKDQDTAKAQLNLPSIPDHIEVSWNCIQGWAGQYEGEGNTAADPAFADVIGPDGVPGTGDEDLRLRSSSPLIDAGNSSRVAPDVFDLDGDGDVAESLPFDLDRNARRVDDPSTDDTGFGPEPIVDTGVYEFQPAGCYPDFTSDGALDLFDFLGYVNAFNAGETAADCDGDKTLTLFDFLCFVNAFNQGC